MKKVVNPWKMGKRIALKHGWIEPYGGCMIRLYAPDYSLYKKLRSELSLCPEQHTLSTLLYDYGWHSQVMDIVNDGVVPSLSLLCKKGVKLDRS